MSQVIITIAYGSEKYIKMARALALSYRRFHPTRQFAIITDELHQAEMSKYFDVVILFNPNYGHGVVQKLHVDLYSPFEETLLVDSDCLFYKSPENLWDLYKSESFSVRWWRYRT